MNKLRTVYSDYTVVELGDIPNKSAPIREFYLLSWDGDKYCEVKEFVSGVLLSIKSGYLYTDWDIYDESNLIPFEWIEQVEEKDNE